MMTSFAEPTSGRITTVPIKVETGSPDQEGRLLFIEDKLVGILILTSDLHAENANMWYIEWASAASRLSHSAPLFSTAELATTFIDCCLRGAQTAKAEGDGLGAVFGLTEQNLASRSGYV